jgi:peptidoglycan/xylan/chitin deacetylase (PgdA/CDA1 family)
MTYFFDRLDKIKKKAMNRFLGTITHVQTSENVVALSFDDGPHPDFTPAILETLEKHKAHATFFMVGRAAQKYPELVRRIAKSGHAIGNHSWDHPSFPLLTGKERRKQIRECSKATAPHGKRLFRPPYGDQTISSRLDAFFLGYKVVTWNLIAYDWQENDSEIIVNHIVKNSTPGSIILFHDALYKTTNDYCINKKLAFHIVDKVLKRMQNKFSFLTIPELLRTGIPVRRDWRQEPNLEFLNQLKVNVR